MIYIAALILLEIILFITNYSPGRYLIGWDNIMPEFNLGLNLERSLFGVWQDYRGLGVLDGMAQAANLFHTIYIFLLSLILPQDLLRFTFIMLTHLVGGIGFFIFSSYIFKNEIEKTKNKIFCFVGALFYMLNLGVIQMYFAPLEVFAFHFAALPWLALFITKALRKPAPKNYLILFLASLLASPQGFVPTVFLVFLILLGTISLFHIIKTGQIKVGLMVILTVLLANAFWLLPYTYSAVKTQSEIRNTRINQFSSEEIFYRNKAHGDIKSVLTLKGFMLNSIEYDQAFGADVLFMLRWYQNYKSLPYQIGFLLILVVTLIGIIITFVRKNWNLLPYAVSMLITFVFLANNTIFFAQVNDLFRTFIPVLGEAFRFPFTKFIILFAFCFSLFLIFGLYSILAWINKRRVSFVLGIIFIFIIFYLSLPAFRGHFISPLLRLEVPSNYKEAFSYFKDQNDNGRVAVFPMYSFWNWQYRDWGNRGSGFFWYGIPQPLMERAFDPWSTYNEQFYNEMANAVDTRDQNLFKDALLKYNVKYILLDTSVLNSLTRYAINYNSLREFIEKSELLVKKNIFGKLIIYEFNGNTSPIFSIDKAEKIYASSKFQKEDVIYNNLGNYIVDENSAKISYLMPSLFSGKLQENLEFDIKEDKDAITFISKKPYSKTLGKNSVLEIPSLYSNEFFIPVEVKASGAKISINLIYPTIYINGGEIEIVENPTVIETSLGSISHITFEDINYSVPFRNGIVKSYLLNNYPNTIRVGDGTRGESFMIDTRNINIYTFLMPIKEERIDNLRIVVKKIKGPFGFDNIISENYDLRRNVGGFELYPDKVFSKMVRGKDKVTFEAAGNSSAEMAFSRDNLFHQASYILIVDSKHESGLPVSFYMDNTFEKRPELETKLSTKKGKNVFIVPKTEEVFSGYGFHFVVKSVGVEKAKAEISKVALYPFPEKTIRNMKIFINPDTPTIAKNTETVPLDYKKLNPSLYRFNPPDKGSYLVLSQAYDEGWKAYEVELKTQNSKVKSLLTATFPFFFGKEIKDHVKVNNWQNGWKIGQSSIIILYLPQYLEYLGISLSILTFIFLLFRLTQNINFGKLNLSKTSAFMNQ
ncbi:MAG: hypothetical protein HYT08_03935 [Candidatus Levybacteria bacterium]|nr:hypothetical protein [Candidatus Levybacteria bacterium]